MKHNSLSLKNKKPLLAWLLKTMMMVAIFYFANTATARDDVKIQSQIFNLGSTKTSVILRGAKQLLETSDDLNEYRSEIVQVSLNALKIFNDGVPLFLEKRETPTPEDALLRLLFKVAPRDEYVIRHLLHLIAKPKRSKQDKKTVLIGLSGVDALRQGSDTWPLKKYLLDAATHSPQAFYTTLIASNRPSARIVAAGVLILANRLTVPAYKNVVQKVIRKWESTHPVILWLLPQIARALQATPSLENLKITQLMQQDVKDVLLAQRMPNGRHSMPVQMLDSMGLYAMTYAELMIEGRAHQLEQLYDNLRVHLSEGARNQFRKGLHFAKTGHRDLAKMNAAEIFIDQLQIEETRKETVDKLLMDADAQTLLVDGLLMTSPRDRKQYLEDIIYYGGGDLANMVVHILLQLDGPDLKAELKSISVCGPYLQGPFDASLN